MQHHRQKDAGRIPRLVWPVRLPSAFDCSSRRWWVLAVAIQGSLIKKWLGSEVNGQRRGCQSQIRRLLAPNAARLNGFEDHVLEIPRKDFLKLRERYSNDLVAHGKALAETAGRPYEKSRASSARRP